MVLFNYSTREITAKIVYYGPGLCGKTTNLQYIHENLPNQVRGKMLSLATKTDRTLFFDFLPIDLGEIRGMKTRVQLYTVPGQVFYNETRKLVLKGADGIVFVADSQDTMLGANVESYKNLEENLKGHGLQLADIPHVIQFNKRDLPRLAAIEDLNAGINKYNAPFYESVAVTGIGVQDTLKAIVKLVLLNLTRKYDPKAAPADERPAAEAAAAARPKAARASVPAPAAAVAPAAMASEAPAPPTPPPAVSSPVARAAAEVSVAGGRGLPASPFSDGEIDGLVDEVEETEDATEMGSTDRPEWTPKPMATAPPPMLAEPAGSPDGGTWMGSTEDEEAATVARSQSILEPTVDLDDIVDAPSEGLSPSHEEGWSGGSSDVYSGASKTGEAPSVTRSEGGSASETAGGPVLLTEVVADEALFDDPGLEVASLDPGEAREIVVPVQLGEGRQARRFKLSIRLRLDPVE